MATAAAAIVAQARQRIVSRFEQAGATSPATAIGFAPRDRRIEQRQFAQLLKHGVLVEAVPGRYYLDHDAMARIRSTVRKRVIRALALGLTVAAAMFALG